MITFDHVSHRFGEIVALRDISLKIPKGTLLAVVGPNGGGKSTFLKLISGLYQPAEGKLTSHIARRTQLAFLPQRSEIDRTFPMRVIDVAAMGLWCQLGMLRHLSTVHRTHLDRSLETVGLKSLEKTPIYALSGGQLQRLLFARLILQDAELILLDEPFAALDRRTTEELMQLICQWHDAGKTIIAVVHDLELVKRYFPMTLLLSKSIISFGNTPNVLTEHNLAASMFHD